MSIYNTILGPVFLFRRLGIPREISLRNCVMVFHLRPLFGAWILLLFNPLVANLKYRYLFGTLLIDTSCNSRDLLFVCRVSKE